MGDVRAGVDGGGEAAGLARHVHPADRHREAELLRGRMLPALLQRVEAGFERIERPRIDVQAAGVEEEVEAGVLPVDRPGNALLGEDVVQHRPKLRPVAVRALADVFRGHALQAGDPGRGADRIGVVGALVADLLEPLGRRRLEVQPLQDRLRPRHRSAGKAAGEDLGEGRQIRGDAVIRLGAAAGDAESGHHLVEDEDDPPLRGDLAQHVDELGPDRQDPEAAAGRLQHDRRDVVPGFEQGAGSVNVVGRGEQDVAGDLFEQPRGRAAVEVVVHPERRVVLPSVEVALEAHQLLLPGAGAREAQRDQVGFRAGGGEPHPLRAGHELLDERSPAHLEVVAGGGMGAERHLALRGPGHLGVAVPEDQGAVPAVVVHVLVAVHVPLVGPEGPLDVDRIGQQPPRIVDDAAREDGARRLGALRRSRGAVAVARHDLRVRGCAVVHGPGSGPNVRSFALTIAVTTSLYGAAVPTSRATTGTMPLMASISEGRFARWSWSTEGRLFGILPPKARACAAGSSNEKRTPFATPAA